MDIREYAFKKISNSDSFCFFDPFDKLLGSKCRTFSLLLTGPGSRHIFQTTHTVSGFGGL